LFSFAHDAMHVDFWVQQSACSCVLPQLQLLGSDDFAFEINHMPRGARRGARLQAKPLPAPPPSQSFAAQPAQPLPAGTLRSTRLYMAMLAAVMMLTRPKGAYCCPGSCAEVHQAHREPLSAGPMARAREASVMETPFTAPAGKRVGRRGGDADAAHIAGVI